jgi:hypothetical protein
VYVVPDGRERFLWLQMTAMGVCGVGCPREVYVVSNGRERCMLVSDVQGRLCSSGRPREVYVSVRYPRGVCSSGRSR